MADDDDGKLRGVAIGFRQRGFKTAKLLARTGFKLALRGAGLSGPANDARSVIDAQALVKELDGLKGLSMKVGQMVSYLDSSLPPAAREVLSKLQSQSRPMAYEVVAEVITKDLGQPPDRLFEEFDRTPFAAASIGQVHRAVLDGKPVAVKVKYPEIEKAIAADVTTIRRLTAVLSVVSRIDVGALIAEVATRVGEECDYTREAANQELMAVIVAAVPDVNVPAVYRSRSGRSVLTTELSPRMRFDAFTKDGAQPARDCAGRAIFQACFRSIFQHGAYNADPHPGNYLFSAQGQVTLLDFGCVKFFEPHFIAAWKRLALTILDEDRAGFRQAFVDAGFVRNPKGFDFDHQWDAMRFLYRPMTLREPFFLDADFIRGVNDRLLFKNQNKYKLDMPPDWLFLNRLQFGLFSVLHHLGARVIWRDIYRACIESPLQVMRVPQQ